MTSTRTTVQTPSITLREVVAAMPIVMLIAALREAFGGPRPVRATRSAAAA